MCNEMHGHSAAKCNHCLSKRFLRTSQNWKQKSSERHDPQQINLMLRHWLKRYKLKWDEMQTLGCKMLLFVKKNPTDNTKLETKIIRKTQSTANQFDAETLTKALQAEVGRNADTRLQQVINCQKESNGQHKTGNKNHQKDTIHSKSIWCWDIDSSSTN